MTNIVLNIFLYGNISKDVKTTSWHWTNMGEDSKKGKTYLAREMSCDWISMTQELSSLREMALI